MIRLLLCLLAAGALADTEAQRKAAERAYRNGEIVSGNAILEALIQANPGNVVLAADFLERIREESLTHRIRDGSVERAVRRILSLRRAGLLNDDHPAITNALRTQAEAQRRQHRLLEAAETMDDMLAVNRENLWVRFEHARFLVENSSPQASERLRQLLADLNPNHVDPQMQRLWNDANNMANRVDGPPMRVHRSGSALASYDPETLSDDWASVAMHSPMQTVSEITRLMRKDDVLAWEHGAMDGWTAIQQHLKRQPAAALSALRSSQEARTRRSRLKLEQADDETLLATFRRYPWSSLGTRCLLTVGRRALWECRPEAARRSFLDVLAHSADADLHEQASVALKALPEPVPAPRPSWKLAELELTPLLLPALSPWPGGEMPVSGAALVDFAESADGLMVSARNFSARYAPTGGAPLWVQARPFHFDHRSRPPIPGPSRPLSDKSRVIERWGYRDVASHIVARGLEDGEILWSSNQPQGDKHQRVGPICDPVLADGRLYYLELSGNHEFNGERALYLVCLGADDGGLIWRSLITDGGRFSNLARSFQKRRREWILFANRVTVHDGAVYSSAAGVVARSDIRDGRTEWLYHYKAEPVYRDSRDITGSAALGSPPLIAGDRVLVAARDCEDLIALDRETGLVAWANALVQPLAVAGQQDGNVLLRGATALAAVDVTDGAVVWHQPLPPEMLGRPVLLGGDLIVGLPNELRRYRARDGLLQEQRPWQARDVRNFTIVGKQLFVVSDACAAVEEESAWVPKGADAEWQPAWQLPRDRPLRLGGDGGLLWLLSNGVLECVRAEDGVAQWQRQVPARVRDAWLSGNTLAMHIWSGHQDRGSNQLLAVDIATGHTRWSQDLPDFHVKPIHVDTQLISYDGHNHARALEFGTGKVAWEQRELGIYREWWPRTHGLVHQGRFQVFSTQRESGALRHRALDLGSGELSGIAKGVAGPQLHIQRSCKLGDSIYLNIRGREWQGEGVYAFTPASGEFRLFKKRAEILFGESPFLVLRDRDSPHPVTVYHQARPDFAYDLVKWSKTMELLGDDRLLTYKGRDQLQVAAPLEARELIEHKTKDGSILGHVRDGDRLLIVDSSGRKGAYLTAYNLATGEAEPTIPLAISEGHIRHPREGDLTLHDKTLVLTLSSGVFAFRR